MYIRIHLYLFLFMAYLFWQGKLELFMMFYFAAIIHEMAHIVMAFLLNENVREFYLMPFGVSARYEENMHGIKEILVSIAGPMISLIMAFLCKSETIRIINIAILIVNILPIYPLDGGRIFKNILIFIMGENKGSKISNVTSKLFIMAMLLLSVLVCIKFKSLNMLFFTLYLLVLYRNEIKKEKILALIKYLQSDE